MADPFDYGVSYLQNTLGLEPHQARGAVRWMRDVESGLNPTIVNPTSGAYGIAQWLDRKPNLFRAYGSNPSIEQQFSFVADELRGPEARALQALRGAKNEDEAFRIWGKAYERPSPAEYAKATGGYSSGLRSFGRPEGRYGGALNLTVRPPGFEFPIGDALDALLRGDPAEGEDTGDPFQMLNDLLAEPPPAAAKPEVAESPAIEAPAAKRPAEPSQIAEPLTSVPPAAPIADLPQSTPPPAQPIEMGQAPTVTPPQAQAPPQGPLHPSNMLDALLQGALSYGEFVRGSGKGLTLPGEELKAALPEMSGPQQIGAAVGRIPGGIVDAARGAGEALRATTAGQPVAAEEMLSAGMFGLKPSVTRLSGGVPGEVPRIHSAVRGTLGDEGGAIRLFHGAARPFDPAPGAPLGRFDPARMGSGEGYHGEGRGGYGSEALKVARWYQREYGEYPTDIVAAAKAKLAAQYPAGSGIDSTSGMRHRFTGEESNYAEYLKKIGLDPDRPSEWVRAAERETDFEPGAKGGALYEMEHPTADPEHFLRWDLPVSQQSPYVRQRLRRLGIQDKTRVKGLDRPIELTGMDVIAHLAEKYGGPGDGVTWASLVKGDEQAANVLKLAGIRGVRYPAGGQAGREGMFNYSVFEPEAMNVLRRLGDDESGALNLRKIVDDIKLAAKGIEKVFSPSSVDRASEAAEMLIRREVGGARRRSEQAEAQVGARGPLTNPTVPWYQAAISEPWRPRVQHYIPGFESYIASKQPGYTGPPVADPPLLRFLDFVETRSRGTTYNGPPELRPLADTLRKVYREREAAIATEPSTTGTHFIEDYYSHQYRDPGAVARSFGGDTAKQGSGRSLRERTIPTLREAIDQGHVPVTPDPIDMTMRYVTNIDRYLAHNRIFRVGRESGMIRFYSGGKAPEGWMPLEGRLAERAVATGGVPGALGLTAYAPEGFARVYNNSVAQGFLHGELGGKAFMAALHTKNAITQSVLSLSGYHAMAMAQEASASALASGIAGLKAGEVSWGLKQLGLGAIPFVKAGKDVFDLGRKFERQYRGIDDYGPDLERVANLYAQAGGRAVGRGIEYQGTAHQNYFTAFRRGQTAMELKAGLRHIGEGNALYAPGRAVGFVGRELARINETITAPLFDKAIPRLKGAAFADEMSLWLKTHPMATYEHQLAEARRIQETIDDRFGELVMDNLFWGKRAKQTLQLAATSLGWEHGSIRSIGGSAFDAVRGDFSPRVRYVIGLGAAIGIMNATYQYLKTGTTPGEGTGGVLSPGGALDLTMPRTGGKTPEGAAERALLPGFEKDVVGYAHDPVGELVGKLSPAGRILGEFWSGRDYFGREIAPFPKYTPEWFKAYSQHVLGSMTPIPFKQEQLKGTAMGQAERFAGNRPAPERWQNPLRQEKLETDSHIRALKGRLAGLYAHGGRTRQDTKETNEKAREILSQIQKAQADYAAKLRESKGSQYLYKPPPLRPSVSGP